MPTDPPERRPGIQPPFFPARLASDSSLQPRETRTQEWDRMGVLFEAKGKGHIGSAGKKLKFLFFSSYQCPEPSAFPVLLHQSKETQCQPFTIPGFFDLLPPALFLAQTLRSRVYSHSILSFPAATTPGSCFQSPEDLPSTSPRAPGPQEHLSVLISAKRDGVGVGVGSHQESQESLSPGDTDRVVSAFIISEPNKPTVSKCKHLQLSEGSFGPPEPLGLDPRWTGGVGSQCPAPPSH